MRNSALNVVVLVFLAAERGRGVRGRRRGRSERERRKKKRIEGGEEEEEEEKRIDAGEGEGGGRGGTDQQQEQQAQEQQQEQQRQQQQQQQQHVQSFFLVVMTNSCGLLVPSVMSQNSAVYDHYNKNKVHVSQSTRGKGNKTCKQAGRQAGVRDARTFAFTH